MKLIYRGRYHSEEQLPKGTLPKNAVQFKEPSSPNEMNKMAVLAALPVAIMIAAFTLLSYFLHGSLHVTLNTSLILLCTVISIPALFIHEWLHAICFGKDSEVELFIAPSKFMLFVVSTTPTTKARFIFMSLCPALVLGVLPFLVWFFLPYHAVASNLLYYFSVMQILCSLGDFINVNNAMRQMPKGSKQQLSGFHSYWYMPQ